MLSVEHSKLDMTDMKKFFILCVVIAVTKIECARILAYFPTPSISHQIVFRPITHALAKRGHEVIVVTADPVFTEGNAPANLTEIDVHDVSYKMWEQLLQNHNGKKQDIMLQILSLFERFATIFDTQMETTVVKNMLKNKDKNYFDILLLEACNRPLLGMAHKFDAPVILISSFGLVPYQYGLMGAPIHPLLYPTPGRQRLYDLTLIEKGLELLKHVGLDYLISFTDEYDYSIMKKNFGDNVPIYEELINKVQMIYVNEHPIWADNHPVPPSIIYIGGIHHAEDKELPKDLKDFLDSSKHGVIYVSFGTNVLPSLLPPEKIQVMTRVFSRLPYDILWKWDTNELPGRSKNIKISKWFPQPDLLKHPKVKLFITQGGLQSTDETIDAAVPVIGIPMLGDQWYNVEKYVYHKIGLQLDITTLAETEFREAITTVIKDKSYKENIMKLRTLMREYPIKPVDNAVWWTEHVIKYGGSHLQSPAANMNWMDYYELKLILITLSILIVTRIECARILAYFPTPSISHQVVFRPLTQALAKRGHEVIVVTTDPAFPKGNGPSNLTEIDVHDISYGMWNELLQYHNGKKQDLVLQIKIIFERITTILDKQLESHEVKNILANKDKKYFDLLLLEACNRPLIGMAHKFDAPVILISSFGAVPLHYYLFGAPIHPFLYPTAGNQRLYNLTLFEKYVELLRQMAVGYFITMTEDFDYKIMKKHFGDDIPALKNFRNVIKMMFLNEHPLWADNHPVPPSIVYIGGIHQSKDRELPQDLKDFLDSSKHGVIYVSFGTNVLPSLLPPEKIQVMTKVFSNLPYDILWKWDKDVLPGQPKNIKISKWFPQPDILKHPNVKLFITQGGLQSTDETIDAAVPVIGIPMLVDQWYNVEKYVRHKIGVQLDITTLTEEEFNKSITTVIENKR
ncbi:unnamed protein product, partial [Brenthis ino]